MANDQLFEQWVKWIFDHPVVEPRWWFQLEAYDEQSALNETRDPDKTLDRMTRLFQSPLALLSDYSHQQIDQGFTFLVSASCSSHMDVLLDSGLPWKVRSECVDAMSLLYKNLMGPIYKNTLGHCIVGSDTNNHACYIWWDAICFDCKTAHANRDQLNESVMLVCERVLRECSWESCLESALHGLGHWSMCFPKRVRNTIASFLKSRQISAELKSYAQMCARGAIE